MQVFNTLIKLGRGFLDLVFPISCQICGQEGVYLCDNCKYKLAKLKLQQCLVCQRPSPFGKTHIDCLTRNTVDGALSTLNHKDERVRNIIKTFKYHFIPDLAKPLSELMFETIKLQGLENYFKEFTIVPIPLHKRRHNWRGFNQASLLAHHLNLKLKLNIEEDLIKRSKHTEPQVKLSADARKKNLENAFTLIENVIDKKILLIDDVITSGSTANELAKLLRQHKASEIWIISAAHG